MVSLKITWKRTWTVAEGETRAPHHPELIEAICGLVSRAAGEV